MINNNLGLIGLATFLAYSGFSAIEAGEAGMEYSSAQDTVTANLVPKGLNIGERAPERASPSPNGEIIKLSSLRGKIVLIDFWASWCLPCRRENPNLVRVYHRFKDARFKNGAGFTIYSISLDQDKARWLGAIAADKLVWNNHVCDLKGSKSEPATKYDVSSLPSNFLIDRNGIILSIDQSVETLTVKLDRLLK